MWSCLLTVALAAETLTLESAWTRAGDAPDAARAAVEEALGAAEHAEAGTWDNPSVAYTGYGRVRGGAEAINGQQHEVTVGVALPVTGALGARLQRGDAAVRLGDARATLVRSDLALAVGTAWYALLAAQAQEDALARAVQRLDGLVWLAEARAEAGAARAWDVDRIRLARETLARRHAAGTQARAEAAAGLAGLLGVSSDALAAEGALAASVEPHLPSTDAHAHARLVAAEAARAREAAALTEARRSRVPAPSVALGGYWTTDGASTSVVGSLAWSLPVFDHGQGRVADALARRAAADADVDAVRAELGAARTAAVEALRALTAVEARELPTGAVVAAAEVAWREGDATMLELVDAVAAEVDAALDTVALHLATRLAELRLAALDGRLDGIIP